MQGKKVVKWITEEWKRYREINEGKKMAEVTLKWNFEKRKGLTAHNYNPTSITWSFYPPT